MLKIELLKEGRMTIGGHSALKMMQNESTPTLDLIVRESVQNSLDAALPDNHDLVEMDFRTGSFSADMLASHFEMIGTRLKDRFAGQSCDFLSISDTGTTGLVGNLNGKFSKDEKNQNLGKLVFKIMEAQEKEGAGGSWGIGKTVYYRIGLGLVIFYSRVQLEQGIYQDRLVAALAEDETTGTGLLSSDTLNQGFAFFGDPDPDTSSQGVIAITDTKRIHDFLSIFHIPPYVGSDTGTTIIIPFINKEEILSSNLGEDEEKKFWQTDLQECLKVSILRWYFPRLSEYYDYGPYLIAFINGKQVLPDMDTPIFKKFQELYDVCCDKCKTPASWITKVPIQRERGNFTDKRLGWFAYGTVTKQDLSIVDKHLPYPFEYCLVENNSGQRNSPIVAFTRKPGMIVNYDTNSGDVVGNISSDPDKYIIGIFSLNSNSEITKPQRINLDEYVRKSERSDHSCWMDYSLSTGKYQPKIIRSIHQLIKDELNRQFGNSVPTTGAGEINFGFARKIGELLLPTNGFGTQGSQKNNRESVSSGIHQKRMNSAIILKRLYHMKSVSLIYHLVLKEKVTKVEGQALVKGLSKNLTPGDYQKGGLTYPFSISSNVFRVTAINGEKIKVSPNIFPKENDNVGGFFYHQLKTNEGKIYGFSLERDVGFKLSSLELDINVTMSYDDPLIQLLFDFEMEEE